MISPNFYITTEQFKMLVLTGSWHINDIPLKSAEKIRAHFGNTDSIALFVSGKEADPNMFTAEDHTLAGIDWIRHETKPKPSEPELNVYHYTVCSGSSGRYPVYYCGHSGSLAPGWSTLKDIEVYLQKSGSSS